MYVLDTFCNIDWKDRFRQTKEAREMISSTLLQYSDQSLESSCLEFAMPSLSCLERTRLEEAICILMLPSNL